jgi:hypothetical protein
MDLTTVVLYLTTSVVNNRKWWIFLALTTLQYNSFIREMLLLFYRGYKNKLCATFAVEIIKSVNASIGYTHSGVVASVITAKSRKNSRQERDRK